jgi:hypothetical protein
MNAGENKGQCMMMQARSDAVSQTQESAGVKTHQMHGMKAMGQGGCCCCMSAMNSGHGAMGCSGFDANTPARAATPAK